jgi:hypothetical protein
VTLLSVSVPPRLLVRLPIWSRRAVAAPPSNMVWRLPAMKACTCRPPSLITSRIATVRPVTVSGWGAVTSRPWRDTDSRRRSWRTASLTPPPVTCTIRAAAPRGARRQNVRVSCPVGANDALT